MSATSPIRRVRRALALIVLVVACLLVAACASQRTTVRSNTQPLVAHVLDVGQGDAIVLDLTDGSHILVDGGDYKSGGTIAQHLRADGAQGLRAIVATHPHADHIGGLADILEEFEVDDVWSSGIDTGAATSREFDEAVHREGATTHVSAVGDVVAEGDGFSIRCIWPPSGREFEDLNDYSAILLVTCENKTLLLTGDAHANIIEEACRNEGVNHVDVLKLAHHGSETGTNNELLQMLTPEIALISCGKDNPYGHPDAEVLDALASNGVTCYATVAQGDLTVSLGPDDVVVTTEREGSISAGEKPEEVQRAEDEAASAARAIETGAQAELRGDGNVVYVTPTGSRYHLKTCSRLKDDAIPLLRDDAIAAGYAPCASCHPDA